jgi:hypothetical protein
VSNALAGVSRKGFGRPGFCKLCAWEHEPELNKLMKAGRNAAQTAQWAKDKHGFTFNRQTFYSHKGHITAPEDKVIAYADREKRGLQPVIRNATNKQFLEAVRDIGYTQAMNDPESVSLDHALKAAGLLEQSKQKTGDITLVFAQVVTGHSPDVIVEGEAREVV